MDDAAEPGRALILISWDGKSAPLGSVDFDAAPDFDILLFDYSGTGAAADTPVALAGTISLKTECKGQIYAALHAYLPASSRHDYVALIDDDIAVAVSALNAALQIARIDALDSFALALTADSYVNHAVFVQRPGSSVRAVPWVEVMMPFYRTELFSAAEPYYRDSISSYGIDQFAMPLMARLTGMTRCAVIDAYTARHHRPVTSDARTFSNGRTARQERIIVRRQCLARLRTDRPDLIGTRWFYKTFSPPGGPARFWLLYLAWPWHAVVGLVSRRHRRQVPQHPPIEAA